MSRAQGDKRFPLRSPGLYRVSTEYITQFNNLGSAHRSLVKITMTGSCEGGSNFLTRTHDGLFVESRQSINNNPSGDPKPESFDGLIQSCDSINWHQQTRNGLNGSGIKQILRF